MRLSNIFKALKILMISTFCPGGDIVEVGCPCLPLDTPDHTTCQHITSVKAFSTLLSSYLLIYWFMFREVIKMKFILYTFGILVLFLSAVYKQVGIYLVWDVKLPNLTLFNQSESFEN